MFVSHESWGSNASPLLGEGHTCMSVVEWLSCYHFYQVVVEELQSAKNGGAPVFSKRCGCA